MTEVVTKGEWFKLPLALRKRWWTETDYGRLQPSAELVAAIKAELASHTAATIVIASDGEAA